MSWQQTSAQLLRSHLPIGSRLLVAVSGGPDSVALAHFLKDQPYFLIIGHVDHGLRKGSGRDARFVEQLARRWDIPVRTKTVHVKAYARSHGLGLEEAARDLRYKALSSMARRNGCAAVVTAHTANDQAETVLMNFLRGSGPTGLAGIPVTRPLDDLDKKPVIRPFLMVKREDILQYVQRHGLSTRHDPTNDSVRFTRNRIRHLTLPYLEKLFPGAAERFVHSADIFRQEEDFWQNLVLSELHKTVRKNGQRIAVVLPQLLRYHKALSRRILRRILPGLPFLDIEHVLTLAHSPHGTGWLKLSGSWSVKRTKKELIAIQKRLG